MITFYQNLKSARAESVVDEISEASPPSVGADLSHRGRKAHLMVSQFE